MRRSAEGEDPRRAISSAYIIAERSNIQNAGSNSSQYHSFLTHAKDHRYTVNRIENNTTLQTPLLEFVRGVVILGNTDSLTHVPQRRTRSAWWWQVTNSVEVIYQKEQHDQCDINRKLCCLIGVYICNQNYNYSYSVQCCEGITSYMTTILLCWVYIPRMRFILLSN